MHESSRPRRCRSQSPNSDRQCEGEVTELAMHIEDHFATRDGVVIERWPVLRFPVEVANPERVKLESYVLPDVPVPASERQVGGDHYRQFKIQVWDIIDEYELSYYAGLTLKYLLRAGSKGSRLEDLEKARHVLDKMIELEKGKEQ
jgi:hypothetical protein